MPANIFGAIQINVISANGVVEFGDTLIISPKVVSKTPAGACGFNSGVFTAAISGLSSTNYFNPVGIDEPIVGNN